MGKYVSIYRSTIDYILTNKNIHPSQILDVSSITTADIGSDHRMVLGKLKTEIEMQTTNSKEIRI
jgi:hypothetical protein